MSNHNNYIAHPLEWTPYTTKEDLPIGKQLAFRATTGELLFGRVQKISNNGVMLIVDGHFDYDFGDILKTSAWACIEFVFTTDD